MQQILLFILLGLPAGALIAGIALGVVLIYRGSGIINLATGGYAMLAGYAFWSLTTDQFGFTLGKVPGLILALLVVVLVAVLFDLVVFRPLRNSAPLAKLVASLGVLLTAQASMLIGFGTSPQEPPAVLPQSVVAMLGGVVPIDGFILAGGVIVAAALLSALYRWTRFGLATRAASENEVAGMLSGLSPTALSLTNTVLAALIAGAIGILASSITALNSSTLPLQIVPALAAALLAGLTSCWIAVLASLGIGVLYSLIDYMSGLSWYPTSGGVALPGVKELIAFLIIVVAMFLRGARLPGRGQLIERGLPHAPKPQRLLATALPLAALCAVALVVLPYDFRQALVNSEIGTVIALSLVVLTGFVGQISVVQLSLAGVAGFTISHLAVNAGIGLPLAPIAGTAAAVVLGLLTAVSALRVRGVSLVVVTLAAAVAIQQFVFTNTTWGGGNTGSPVPEPTLLGLDLGPNAPFRGLDGNIPSPVFGWFALVVTLLLCLLVGYLRRGGMGQRMLAVRANERASAAVAIDTRKVKLIAFGISAFIAGIAGSLYAYNFGSVSEDRFDAFTALSLIAFAYAGGITLISGAVFAGLISTQALFPYMLDKWLGVNGNYFLLFGGVILIVTLLQNPAGVAGTFYAKTHRRRPPVEPRRTADAEPAPLAGPRRELGATALQTRGVSVDFGGVHALRAVDLAVRDGELVGLIGPNGAGKTTLVDAITGFVPYGGSIELDARTIDGMAAHARARLGIARTWQSGELFDDLLVQENLAVASNRDPAWKVMFSSGSETQAVTDALELLGIAWAADALPSDLSQGHRKLVGVARAIAARPRVLLLDEPAAGLDLNESRELGRHLRALANAGQSTLLIDHDMGLVLGICDRVVVLEFGEVIADGEPEKVRRDPRVEAAYLGSAIEPGTADPNAAAATATQVASGTGTRRAAPAPSVASAPVDADASVPLLRVDALTAGYDDAAVVRQVGLSVWPGEVVALMGANGAGKTTTLRAISGLLKPMGGSIRFAGEDLSRSSPTERARMGIVQVPEGRGIFYGLTVAEHFRFGYRSDPGEEEAVLSSFPALLELRDRRAGLLSGGEQQMLAIARALTRRPKLLLLDELSLGLAPLIVERLLPVVREFATSQGTAVLLVEQHVHLGLEIADRGYVLSHGEIVAEGSAETLRNDNQLLLTSYLGEQAAPLASHPA